jgi:hypothetical protein
MSRSSRRRRRRQRRVQAQTYDWVHSPSTPLEPPIYRASLEPDPVPDHLPLVIGICLIASALAVNFGIYNKHPEACYGLERTRIEVTDLSQRHYVNTLYLLRYPKGKTVLYYSTEEIPQ